MTVKRGDIYYADLSPVVGSEQGGVRPVLIVQNDVGNKYSPTVIAAAITSQTGKTRLPTHINIPGGSVGLSKDSVIRVFAQANQIGEHIQTYDSFDVLVEARGDDEALRRYCKMVSMTHRVIGDVHTDLREDPVKCLVINYEKKDGLLQMQDWIRANMEGMDCFFSCEQFLEVVPKGMNKGEAVKMLCKLLGVACKEEGKVAAFVQPNLFPADAITASVPTNFNLITYDTAYTGRMSYYGQGAGRYPTGANVVQDLLDIAGGKEEFYSKESSPCAIANEIVSFQYYLRTTSAKKDAVKAEDWGDAVLTQKMSVAAMAKLLEEIKEEDPRAFIAAVRS